MSTLDKSGSTPKTNGSAVPREKIYVQFKIKSTKHLPADKERRK